MKSSEVPYDVAIVGAGPIGLATAAELQRRGLSTVIFDRGSIGHTISWFPRGMRFNSSAINLELLGFPVPTIDSDKPTRESYLAYLRDFTRYFDVTVNAYEEVLAITPAPDGFEIETRRKSGQDFAYQAANVVLAIGSNEFPRRLGIEGEDLPHVSHYLTEPHQYFGQRVVIVGGRNSAAEAAIRLTHLGARVTLVHRQPDLDLNHLKYWLGPELSGMIAKGRVEAHFSSVPTRILPDAIEVSQPGGKRRLACDFVLLLIGYVPDYTLIDQLGVQTHKAQREPLVNPATLETNVPGVYCAGTIVAGDQNPYRVFIENALHHPGVIAAAILAKSRSSLGAGRTG